MTTKTIHRTPDLFPLHDIRVVDGDTIVATIPLPFKTSVRKTIRLKGWWAAELHTEFHTEAVRAAQRLHDFCKEKALWLLTANCRLDRYGRVIGHLQYEGRLISPREVLGDLSLSATEHKHRHDRQALSGKPRTTPFEPSAGIPIAESAQNASTRPLGPKSTWVPMQELTDGQLAWKCKPKSWPCPCGPEGTHQGLEICPEHIREANDD